MKFGDRIKSLVISPYSLVISQLTVVRTATINLLGLQGKFYRSQRLQKTLKVILGLILCWGTILMPAAIASAASDLSRQPVTEITVSLGNEAGELKFFSNQLEFESGKRYKLVLKNPSSQKHYFTAKNFADASWTQKLKRVR
jgi:hypothetical protein